MCSAFGEQASGGQWSSLSFCGILHEFSSFSEFPAFMGGGARVCALACVLVRVAQGTPCSDSSAVVCARVERDACSDTWFAARCCASCARLSKLAEVAVDDIAATLHASTANTHAISVARSVNQSSVDVSDVFASALREQAAREQAAREQLDPLASTH